MRSTISQRGPGDRGSKHLERLCPAALRNSSSSRSSARNPRWSRRSRRSSERRWNRRCSRRSANIISNYQIFDGIVEKIAGGTVETLVGNAVDSRSTAFSSQGPESAFDDAAEDVTNGRYRHDRLSDARRGQILTRCQASPHSGPTHTQASRLALLPGGLECQPCRRRREHSGETDGLGCHGRPGKHGDQSAAASFVVNVFIDGEKAGTITLNAAGGYDGSLTLRATTRPPRSSRPEITP